MKRKLESEADPTDPPWNCDNCDAEITEWERETGELNIEIHEKYTWNERGFQILCQDCLQALREKGLEEIVNEVLP
jgi:hypothetical protein